MENLHDRRKINLHSARIAPDNGGLKTAEFIWYEDTFR